jgi:hypothetical protein
MAVREGVREATKPMSWARHPAQQCKRLCVKPGGGGERDTPWRRPSCRGRHALLHGRRGRHGHRHARRLARRSPARRRARRRARRSLARRHGRLEVVGVVSGRVCVGR